MSKTERTQVECVECGRSIHILKDDAPICDPCFDQDEAELAKQSVLGHLASAGICLILLEFRGVVVELVWALSRLLRVGDYAAGGYFDQKRIPWR